MARPKTKEELLTLSETNFDLLFRFIEALSPEEREGEFPPGTMNRNIRDVLMHLHHWHLLMLNWYKTGMEGRKPEMPAKGHTWKTTRELNAWIWNHYRETSLNQAIERLKDSHLQVTALIKKHSEEELFEKKRYPWTGSTSLGAYLISATSSHYDWALKLLRKAFR